MQLRNESLEAEFYVVPHLLFCSFLAHKYPWGSFMLWHLVGCWDSQGNKNNTVLDLRELKVCR